MKQIVVQFARLGPYHVARLESAAEVLGAMGWRVVALETASKDAIYQWDKTNSKHKNFERRTVFEDQVFEEISSSALKTGIFRALNILRPEVVVVAGWGTVDARACLAWCKRHGAKAIVMSETRAVDGRRVWLKEWLKSRIVRQFDGGLCGGQSHKQYLIDLGIPAERISFGYNIVDNDIFKRIRSSENLSAGNTHSALLTGPYFLASNRFVQRKNLARLIQAYAKYTESFRGSGFQVPERGERGVWPLVLLGDGELRKELEELCVELGIRTARGFSLGDTEHAEGGHLELNSYKLKTPAGAGMVIFAGFRQIKELPVFYGSAGAFIHPALSEPWGLVINEAMASGLPIISSRNVGAAEELVENGKTGFLFDPKNIEQLADLMTRVACMSLAERENMGLAGAQLLERKMPKCAFGKGLAQLIGAKEK